MTWLEFDVSMQLGGLCVGGFVFLEGGFAKRGVRANPPNPPPPGYGPDADVVIVRKAI